MRNDVHKPSAIVPADYQFVAMGYQGPTWFNAGAILAEREALARHMAQTGGSFSRHAHGGNCHICGAHCVYTVIFYHGPSNSYIKTGMDCAEKLEYDSGAGERFRANIQDARANQAGKAKAECLMHDHNLALAWSVFADSNRVNKWEENTIADIVGKLCQYGNLSDKQWSFLAGLQDKIVNRATLEAKRQAEHDAAKELPLSEQRMTVIGVVLTVKEKEFGIKILVQHSDGWKVWGSLPKALANVKKGDTISFDAKVKASDNDSKFGFFSRPTKATVIKEA